MAELKHKATFHVEKKLLRAFKVKCVKVDKKQSEIIEYYMRVFTDGKQVSHE